MQVTFQCDATVPLCPFLQNENVLYPLSDEAQLLRVAACEVDGSRHAFNRNDFAYVYYVPFSECFPHYSHFDDGSNAERSSGSDSDDE